MGEKINILDVSVRAGRVLTVPEILEHPHIGERRFITSFPAGSVTGVDQHLTGRGFQLDGEAAIPATPAPSLSQHTASWLGKLGYNDTQIATLREEGTI